MLKTCSNQQKSVLKPNVLEQLPIPDVSDHRIHFFFPHCLQSSVWPYCRRNFLHLTSVIWSLSITRPRNGRAKQRCNAAAVSEVSNTLSSADYDAVMVARTAVIAPTAKVLRIEARDEELPFALRQSLSLSTEEHVRPARTGNMVSI